MDVKYDMNTDQDILNVDNGEVSKFDNMAARWWDTEGEFRPLHDLNPARLKFIRQHTAIGGKKILDIGCGGGILSEAMVREGARVTGIDLSQKALTVARLHAEEAGIELDYRHTSAEQHAATHAGEYDAVTCLELLEHVPNPASLIQAATQLVKSGGRIFFSTLNRNPKAYILAILGAEYIMRLLPRGTHDYSRFITPSELARQARATGLILIQEAGIRYNPLLHTASLVRSVDVNYLMCFGKPAE